MSGLSLESILNALVMGVAGLLLWVFRGTISKASEAHSATDDLKRRVHNLENKVDEFQDIRISVGKLETETKNIEQTLKRIEALLMRTQ